MSENPNDPNFAMDIDGQLLATLADMMATWAELAEGHKQKLVSMGWDKDNAEEVALQIHLGLVHIWVLSSTESSIS